MSLLIPDFHQFSHSTTLSKSLRPFTQSDSLDFNRVTHKRNAIVGPHGHPNRSLVARRSGSLRDVPNFDPVTICDLPDTISFPWEMCILLLKSNHHNKIIILLSAALNNLMLFVYSPQHLLTHKFPKSSSFILQLPYLFF